MGVTEQLKNAKAYRPISLTSYNLKTLEKIVDIHTRQKKLS